MVLVGINSHASASARPESYTSARTIEFLNVIPPESRHPGNIIPFQTSVPGADHHTMDLKRTNCTGTRVQRN